MRERPATAVAGLPSPRPSDGRGAGGEGGVPRSAVPAPLCPS